MIVLNSCNLDDRKKEVLMSDKDFVENERVYSPDSSMFILNYCLDLGAYDYGQGGAAILKLTDAKKNLRDYTIPNTLTRLTWIDNQTISAKYDILPSLRSGEKLTLNDEEMNGVKIKVTAYDYIDKDDHLEIEHQAISPNRQFELIVYRYLKDRNNMKFIHISVIPVGGKIPKYGNYFIADIHSDYVLNATWTESNELKFYSNSNYSHLIQYFLVEDRIKIDYKIVTDDKAYGSKYLWIGESNK